MRLKQRLSASVDAGLIAAAEAAVKAGRAPSISAWVSRAMERQLEHDKRMQALDAFLKRYEREHGVITEEEIAEASRWARRRALVAREPSRPRGHARTGKRSA